MTRMAQITGDLLWGEGYVLTVGKNLPWTIQVDLFLFAYVFFCIYCVYCIEIRLGNGTIHISILWQWKVLSWQCNLVSPGLLKGSSLN